MTGLNQSPENLPACPIINTENEFTITMDREEEKLPGSRTRILLVDDDPDIALLFKARLENSVFVVHCAHDLAEMRRLLTRYRFDAVLLDLFLREESGLDGIPSILQQRPDMPIVILTGHGSIEGAINAIDQGASAFLLKSDPPEVIHDKLIKLLFHHNDDPSLTIKTFAENHGIYGTSQNILNVIRKIEMIKDVDSTVLIYGESGTGKELVAKALHETSKRKNNRFAAINCGAIPENLLESELFGYRKGAFTDAKTDRKGVFEYCCDGTLLLDEIGEMPLPLQVKLLRVLQEMEITPVGGNVAIPINTRIIAATNKDLRDLVKKGRFREDLFFRLNVIDIKIPPLRKRPMDLAVLANHFIAKYSGKYNKKISPLAKKCLTRLIAYDWPGNVRELQNMIERGTVMSTDGRLHLEDMFSQHLATPIDEEELESAELPGFVDGFPLPFSEAKQVFERAYIKRLLNVTRGNIAEAARISGQYRANLYRMMAKYKIQVDYFKNQL